MSRHLSSRRQSSPSSTSADQDKAKISFEKLLETIQLSPLSQRDSAARLAKLRYKHFMNLLDQLLELILAKMIFSILFINLYKMNGFVYRKNLVSECKAGNCTSNSVPPPLSLGYEGPSISSSSGNLLSESVSNCNNYSWAPPLYQTHKHGELILPKVIKIFTDYLLLCLFSPLFQVRKKVRKRRQLLITQHRIKPRQAIEFFLSLPLFINHAFFNGCRIAYGTQTRNKICSCSRSLAVKYYFHVYFIYHLLGKKLGNK